MAWARGGSGGIGSGDALIVRGDSEPLRNSAGPSTLSWEAFKSPPVMPSFSQPRSPTMRSREIVLATCQKPNSRATTAFLLFWAEKTLLLDIGPRLIYDLASPKIKTTRILSSRFNGSQGVNESEAQNTMGHCRAALRKVSTRLLLTPDNFDKEEFPEVQWRLEITPDLDQAHPFFQSTPCWLKKREQTPTDLRWD